MLTGHCPFEAETPAELVFCHMAKEPPDLRSLLPNLPPMLAAVINKLLSKMAKDRYVSCDGLLYDLERCRTEQEFVLGKGTSAGVLSSPVSCTDGKLRLCS